MTITKNQSVVLAHNNMNTADQDLINEKTVGINCDKHSEHIHTSGCQKDFDCPQEVCGCDEEDDSEPNLDK